MLRTLFNFLCPSQLSADEQRKIGLNKTDPYGGIAQLGEHLPCKQGVMSSNLIISTTFGRAKAYLRRNPNLENQITRKRKDEKTKRLLREILTTSIKGKNIERSDYS